MLRTKSQFAAECVDKFVLFCDFWCIALAITGTIYMPRVKLGNKTLWQRLEQVMTPREPTPEESARRETGYHPVDYYLIDYSSLIDYSVVLAVSVGVVFGGE